MSCKAVIKSGKGCSRKATNNTDYCTQHFKLNQSAETKEHIINNNYVPPQTQDLQKLEAQYVTDIEAEVKLGLIKVKTEIDTVLLQKKEEIKELKNLPDAEPSTSEKRAIFKAGIRSIISNFINRRMYELIHALEATKIFKYEGNLGDSETNTYYNIRILHGHQIQKYFDIPISYEISISVGEYPNNSINSWGITNLVIAKLNKKSIRKLLELLTKDLQPSLYSTFTNLIYTEIELLKYLYEKTSDLIVYDFNPY